MPDQDCAPGGSYHTGHQPHPYQYLSDPHCTDKGSYLVHSEYLKMQVNNIKPVFYNVLKDMFKLIWPRNLRTISINVHGTCITFTVVICISLVRVAVVWAVVTAITNIIPIIVILSGIENEWAIVLF